MFPPGEGPSGTGAGNRAAGYSKNHPAPEEAQEARLLVGVGGRLDLRAEAARPGRIASSAGNNMLNAKATPGGSRASLWSVARARSQVCTSVSLQSSRPMRSSRGIGAKRPDTGADARSGSASASRISAVAARHAARRGRGRLPAAVERSCRDRPPLAGAPTRRGPRGPAHVHSVHGVGADHASPDRPTTHASNPRSRSRLALEPATRASPTLVGWTQGRSVRCPGLMWLPWKAALALAVALAIVPLLVVFGLFAPPAPPPPFVFRTVVCPRDRHRPGAVRALAVRGHAVAPEGQRAASIARALDLPPRALSCTCPSEVSVQHLVLHSSLLTQALNVFYTTVHFPR